MNGTTTNNPSPAINAGSLVYVVDDEPMLLELASVILEPQGYPVRTFRDPEMALEFYTKAQPRPALVITDYAMHSMNGMELIEKFRALEPEQKILLISGTVSEDIFRDSPIRPDRFLAKPYLADHFTSVVKDLIAGK